MGRAARVRARRSHGHRGQPQRPGNALVRWHSDCDGERRGGVENLRLARNRDERRERCGPGDRAIRVAGGWTLRLTRGFCAPYRVAGRAALLLLLAVLAAPALRAEYIVLRSGQRLKVTGYQLLGDKYHLQLSGGFVAIAAAHVVAVAPEDGFFALAAALPPPSHP